MASGDTLIQFSPLNNEPPSSNYATLDTINLHPVLDFDASTDESAVFSSVMPQHYAGTTGVTVYLHWLTSVTSNDVIWDVSFERVGDGQLDIDAGDSFTAVNSVTDTAPGTAGFVTIASVAFTDGPDMDSIAVGEGFRLKVTRDANNGSDTLAADTSLRWVEIRET